MNIRPMTHDERKYGYGQSQQLTCQTGCVGCLSGTLDGAGDTAPSWRGPQGPEEFCTDRDVVLQALRHDGCILSDRSRMQAYCLEHPDGAMDRESREYGFRMDTGKYAYLLRLNPREGGMCLSCYIRERLDGHIRNALRGIRFITPRYDDLFRLRDGDKIRITTPDGRRLDRTCRYIDETHVEVGAYPRGELYHICQFAELMEKVGNRVEPLRSPACEIRNLSQLKRCLRPGRTLEIIGHRRPECVGQIRKVTLANTQGFYSVVDGLPLDGWPNSGNDGKGPVLDWGKAAFWTFRDGTCGVYGDEDHTDGSLIMAFRVLDDAA